MNINTLAPKKYPEFQTPFPGELLCSVIGRCHLWNRHGGYEQTLHELFKNKFVTAIFDLPTQIQVLCDALPDEAGYTAEHFIENHTLFPLYRIFLPKARAEKIESIMKQTNK